MSTLLLRLAAPLQAWGLDSKFDRRGTERAPTKSAVIGMLAAALGRRRDESESLIDLSIGLRFGVRVDREGTLLRDFHTAKSVSEKHPYVTQRYYLCDAVFLVGLQGEDALLEQLEWALNHPVFPLFLGRRSCPPEGRLTLAINRGKTLEEVLREVPRLIAVAHGRNRSTDTRLRMIVSAQTGDEGAYFQRDEPLSFDQTRREYGFRRVVETWIDSPADHSHVKHEEQTHTQHNAYAELED